jgi:hypothetical protein
MAESKEYDPFIFLQTRVVQAASDMIEEIGRLNGIRSVNVPHVHEPYQMAGLREAIAKATRTLSSYDACMSADIEKLTSSAFEDAASHAGEAA